MADDPNKVDGLEIGIGGDDTDYEEMTKAIIRETEEMAEKVKRDTSGMVNHVISEQQRARTAAQQSKISGGGKLGPDMLGPMPSLRDLFPEVAGMEKQLEGMKQTVAETKALNAELTAFQRVSKAFPAALGEAAPALGRFSTGAGTAAASLATIGEAALPVTLAIGAFGAAFYATTYLISGSEGAYTAHSTLLEGLKYVLKGVTLGYVDYTEAAKLAKEGQAALDSQMISGKNMVRQYAEARAALFQGMGEQVAALKDHSLEKQLEFTKEFIGAVEKVGPALSDEAKATIASNIGLKFGIAATDEMIKKLEKEAETYKMSKEQVMEYTLNINNATDAQKAHARELMGKMKAKDREIEMEKEAKKAAEEAAREAKRMTEEAKRERARLVKEGESFHDAMRTPMEKLQDEAKHARDLFREGVISVEDYKRAIAKLEEGPKEHVHKIKFITEHDVGVRPAEFGSADELAAREAYLTNLAMGKEKPSVKKMDAEVRSRGLIPNYRSLGGTPVSKEELETRALLNEMKEHLAVIAGNTGRGRMLTVSPAKLGRGR